MSVILSCIFGALIYIGLEIKRVADTLEKRARVTDGGTNG